MCRRISPPCVAEELLRSGDFNAAEAIFRQQIEIDLNDADGLLGLSAIMRKRRSRKDARELFTKAVQAWPIERSGKQTRYRSATTARFYERRGWSSDGGNRICQGAFRTRPFTAR